MPPKKRPLQNLLLIYIVRFYDDNLDLNTLKYTEFKQCCRDNLHANNETKFCSDCGKYLQDKEFSGEEFMHYVSGLHGTTTDNYDSAEYARTRNLAWWPFWQSNIFAAPKDDVLILLENAEETLLAALLEAMPELQKFCEWSSKDWELIKQELQPEY